MGTPVIGDTAAMHVRDLGYITSHKSNKPPIVLACVGGAWANPRNAFGAISIAVSSTTVADALVEVSLAASVEASSTVDVVLAHGMAAAVADVDSFMIQFAASFPPK